MNQDQLDVLNITQQTLRGVVIALLAMHPDRAGAVASALKAFAESGGIAPMSHQMLLDLAAGVSAVAPGPGGSH